MKKLELIFAGLLVPLDYLALLLAGSLAYFLRFESFVTEIRPVVFEMSYAGFFEILSAVAVAWIAVFALNGLYSVKRQSFAVYLFKIIVACSAATLIIVVAFFFNFQLFSSRLIILTGWLLSIVIVALERLIIFYVKKIFYKQGIGVRKVVIIGANKSAADISQAFAQHPTFGFRVLKDFAEFNRSTEEELRFLNKQNQVDDVILASTGLPEEQKVALVNFCLEHQLNYKYAASLLDTKLINFELSEVAGVPLIEVKQTRLDGWGRIIKRLFDLLAALIISLMLFPLWLIIGLTVKLTSAGPMIVALPRVGAYGQKFRLYKYRSMVKDAHLLKTGLQNFNQRSDGPLFKMDNDPRLTHFGKFIRKWSLDELPQLVNVLAGHMSLVGPRPHEPEEVNHYQRSEKKLLAIKPGLTGLAQVAGRSDLLWEEEVRLDTYYLEHWSLSLDLQILLKTPRAVFSRRQAP